MLYSIVQLSHTLWEPFISGFELQIFVPRCTLQHARQTSVLGSTYVALLVRVVAKNHILMLTAAEDILIPLGPVKR
jgi:hypothetical protein